MQYICLPYTHDNTLLNYLIEQRVPVETCPISNVRTGVVESYEEHPVKRYHEQGMFLSINMDDPKMFGNSLAEEYFLLVEKRGFTASEIKDLVLGSIKMSWMPEDGKGQMKKSLTRIRFGLCI